MILCLFLKTSFWLNIQDQFGSLYLFPMLMKGTLKGNFWRLQYSPYLKLSVA